MDECERYPHNHMNGGRIEASMVDFKEQARYEILH